MLFALEDKRLLRKKLQTKLQQARKERKVSLPGTHRRSQDFSKGGGGSHCVIVRELTRLSCRLKIKFQKKGFLTMAKKLSWHFQHLL